MLADLFARRFGIGQALAEPLCLYLQLRRFGAECFLLYRAGKVAVQEPPLHLLELSEPLAGLAILFFTQTVLIITGRRQMPAEPVAAFVVRDAKRGEIVLDSLFELVLPPTNHRMVGGGFEVTAAVIDVLMDLAALHPAHDTLAGDAVSAVGTGKHPAGQVVIGIAHPTVLAFEQVLAALEDLQVDDWLVLAGVGLPAERHHADVEAVVEDVRQGRAVEAWVADLIREAVTLQHVGDVLERVQPRRVQLENALHRQGVDGMRLDRFLAVIADVPIAERSEAGCPSLADLLLDSLEHLVAQVIAVVLRHGGHDIERQRTCCARPELVIDEGKVDAAGVLEFLHPYRVAHVTADAVELVGQDRADLQLAGVGPDPLEHLVEGGAFRPPFRRFSHHEFAEDGPAFLLRPLAGDAELGIEGVALPLFPR